MKKILPLACLLTLCNLALFAQTEERPRIVHTTEKSAIHVPPQEAPAGLKKIYSDLGTSETDLYNDATGYALYLQEFLAMPFTPKSDSHVSLVRVAVSYSSGANQVNLNIYEDSDGAPGDLLAGPVTVTNLTDSGTCCTLAVAHFTPVAITGGTKYWVVADTPLSGTGSDFFGVWNSVVEPVLPIAINNGGGWRGQSGDLLFAGEVLGTIP